MNYYFEIESSWAKGRKEMFLLTTILDTQINEFIENKIEQLFQEFETKVNKTPDIFKGIYLEEIDRLEEKEKKDIKTKADNIRSYLKEFNDTVDNMIKNIKKS
ncbi:MAG: hypothetical protein P8Y23_07760 [Candidatus Lokiarchaeota archaeon]|jgi:hypothetical protein